VKFNIGIRLQSELHIHGETEGVNEGELKKIYGKMCWEYMGAWGQIVM
jgi:hypothetical protein